MQGSTYDPFGTEQEVRSERTPLVLNAVVLIFDAPTACGKNLFDFVIAPGSVVMWVVGVVGVIVVFVVVGGVCCCCRWLLVAGCWLSDVGSWLSVGGCFCCCP